jgi:aryl-alcohol dehydrogenase-like predicted oxidoreductase
MVLFSVCHGLQVLRSVADKHSTSVSNVASRWVLQRPAGPGVILGARNALPVPDHQQLFSFSLDDSDLAAIQEVLDAGQQPKGDCYTWERGGVF